ncbi:MAG: hypothetical protein WC343_04545, partial [Bacilli bacterium]
MKIVKKIIFVLAVFMIMLPLKADASSNVVNLYLFYREDCMHCAALEKDLGEIKKDYPNLRIYSYEVLSSSKNRSLMNEAASLLDVDVSGVPFTIIGTRSFSGYSATQTRAEIEYVLSLYSSVSLYKDPVGEMLGVEYSKGTLTYENLTNGASTNDNYFIDVPLIGAVSTKNLSLPLVSILIGTVDGFNPCAMWVLLFLISVLIGMKDRKRMWILGSSFIVTSGLIYLAFMLAWFNIASIIGTVSWVQLLIALAALIGCYYNLKAFFKTKESGCEIIDEDKRKKLFTRIRKVASEKFLISLVGIITLAVSVNFVELTCSAGLPVIFTNILAMNNLSTMEYLIYFLLYIF